MYKIRVTLSPSKHSCGSPEFLPFSWTQAQEGLSEGMLVFNTYARHL